MKLKLKAVVIGHHVVIHYIKMFFSKTGITFVS